ncbi:MAG: HAD-IB family phosphatase [Sphingobacteriales bacterium]|nr:HAD-IB family phosphatase [Sphingobacteriales bacterium]
MVSVIIPALNEEATIRKVIQIVKRSAAVGEIIVVDDKSTDATVKEARKEQVKIFTSSKKGKGISMREGIMLASHDIVAFVDADITTYPDDVIDRLTLPIMEEKADFVKSYFERQAGRVTELVAKPLLSFLFPSISHFKQPLSGMIAGKKEYFQRILIEDDYGVDIGILIDMHKEGARIAEVSLGYIENRMQSITQLAKMSKEVTKAILKRSGQFLEDTFETITGIHFGEDEQLEFAAKESNKKYRRMAIFDMDKTILKASFIYTLADKFSFTDELKAIAKMAINPFIRIKQIAQLLKGIPIYEILKTADEIEIVEDTAQVIKELQFRGYVCGIISESYDAVTNHIANKLGLDFSLANELEFHRGVATGEVKIPSFFLYNKHSICKHDYCKTNAVLELSKRFNIEIKNIMAVGNGKNDICMIKNAGVGVSFCTDNKQLETAADHRIAEPAFTGLLAF